MVSDRRAESFDDFCRRVHPRLVGALVLHCGDSSLAEEFAQEALSRAWERWRSVAVMESRDGWVFRVAWNLANSHFRRRRAERRATDRVRSEAASATDSADAVAIRNAVGRLPPRERAAVVLRYFADLDVATTAEVMRCQPGTVKALTHQGVAHLRQWLGEGEEVLHDV